jgi:hypothetical protein
MGADSQRKRYDGEHGEARPPRQAPPGVPEVF